MNSSGGAVVRCAAVVLVGLLLGLLTVAPATAQTDREKEMRKQLASTGVYLETAPAQGNLSLWRERLERSARQADLGAPVEVILWTPVKGLWPPTEGLYDGNDASTLRKLNLPPGSIALLSDAQGFLLVEHAIEDGAVRDRVDAWQAQAEAVVRRLVSASPDPERFRTLTSVAQAWIHLRLAASDAPPPQRLVKQLSGDVTLFVDRATLPDPQDNPDGEGSSFANPVAIVIAAALILGTVAWFLWRTWSTPRGTLAERVAAPRKRRPDPILASLGSLALEEDLTALAREISESEVRPGEAAYDKAQACLDAAAKYVDSDKERDRIGVHLLVADGRSSLAGDEPRKKCFFSPLHTAVTTVKRDEVALPCCLRCANEVSAGSEPGALFVTDEEGFVRPYYETQDVWTTTGYGAIDRRWAKRALLAALEARR